MFKKLLCIILISVSVFTVGCSNSKQIDKASITETVTVDELNDQRVYTFYLLSSEEKPKFIAVPSDNLKNACTLAREKYIPNLSLAKIELYAVNEKIYSDVLIDDIIFISKQSDISPVANVILCDSETLGKFPQEKEMAENIAEHIVLLKKKDKSVSTDCLSIFNNFSNMNKGELSVSYINSKNELKTEAIKINVKK